MENPYKTLGVDQNASDEDIKKAYRELVRKYHPDQYHDNPLAALAEERLKEINEAYSEIEKQRSSAGRQYGTSDGSGVYRNSSYGTGNAGGSGTSGDSGYWSGTSDQQFYQKVRAIINAGRIQTAEGMLDATADRSAEWFFLRGICYIRKGWNTEGLNHISRAAAMEPSNIEYRQALMSIQNNTQTYTASGFGGGAGLSRFCETLMCMRCLCCF